MRRARGSVVVVVVWSVAIAAVMVAATQIVTYRQAVVGRESLARVEARWGRARASSR
jgi:type II secretory pathway component PulK